MVERPVRRVPADGPDLLAAWLGRLPRPAPTTGPSPPLAEELERVVLGGARRYTRIEVEAHSGIAHERNELLWRALGFADVADDDVVFTDADVEALGLIDGLVEAGVVDQAIEVAAARAVGRSLSRLAEWEIGLLADHVLRHVEDGDEESDESRVLPAAEAILATMEHLHAYVWRRHIAALAGRALVASDAEMESGALVVGFADVVGYTRLTRDLPEAGLATLIGRFESIAGDVIATAGGRVVKTLGDEVLFVVDDPAVAAETALGLLDEIAAQDDMPDLRIGMAFGSVLSRFGDVYGPVVNIASRLTSAAKPGTVLVDRDLAAALDDVPGLRLKRRRPLSVRGYSNLSSSRLTRAPVAPPSEDADETATTDGLPPTSAADDAS